MGNKKHIQWLEGELPLWLEKRWIEPDRAQQLQQYYAAHQQPGALGRSVFSAMGGVLFGLGIILFFAYNWQEMHRALKLTIIFSALVAAHLGALWFDSPSRQQRGAAEGLALLGTVLFGAAIWLISQIYHIDEHYPNAFWLWGAAALAMAWARQSALQCLAALVLLFVWGCLEIFPYGQLYHGAPWWILFGAGLLAWRLRSPPLLFLSVSGFYFLWIASMFEPLDDTVFYLVFTFSIALIQFGHLSERLRSGTARPFRFALALPGFAAYLAIVYAMTFVHFLDGSDHLELFKTPLQTAAFWLCLLVVILLLLSPVFRIPHGTTAVETDRLHGALIGLSSVLAFTVGPGWIHLSYGMLSGIMNLVFMGHCLLFILHGSQQQRGWEVSAGCTLFAALVFARYTDLFDSLLSRSLVFLVLGAALFVVGNFYTRHKKLLNTQGGASP